MNLVNSDRLVTQVTNMFLPAVGWCGLEVTEQEESPSFGNAHVVLQQAVLRLRIVRERSQVFVDFGSRAEPNTWFDSAVVMDYLGVSADSGFHSREARSVLDGLSSFLKAFWPELTRKFDPINYPLTRAELTALRDARAERRFGVSE